MSRTHVRIAYLFVHVHASEKQSRRQSQAESDAILARGLGDVGVRNAVAKFENHVRTLGFAFLSCNFVISFHQALAAAREAS